MVVAKAIFSHFLTFIMAIVMVCYPYAGFEKREIDNLQDDCRLTVEMISDTHFKEKEIFGWSFFNIALKNMSRAKCKIDGIIVDGDITNYADEATLAKYYSTIKEKSPAQVISVGGNHDIGHAGDRGKTDITRQQALENFIRYRNDYFGTDSDKNYYSMKINGYTFIVVGDEVLNGGEFDFPTISQEQFDFIEKELAEGTKEGKPVFVCCHWPIKNINGETIIWPGSGIDPIVRYDLPKILEKYKNVFWISGHMHSGIKDTEFAKITKLSNVETLNGVTYVNLPSFGLVNMFGFPFSGTGAQLEVYDSEVVIRPVNYLTDFWFKNSVFRIPIEK